MESFDVIIIGVGQAGNPLATAFSDAGKRTAVIEELYVGGSCINYGCTPTKIMIASAERAHLTRQSRRVGVESGATQVDFEAIIARKDQIVSSFRKGIQTRIQKSSSELIYGHASFSGHKTVTVDLRNGGKRTLQAETIIIDTGSSPRIPNLPGLDGITYLTSSSILDLKSLPDKLLIIGGGYIALEFGQMFRRFGSQVEIIELGDQLLAREDPDVARAVQQIMEDEDIHVWLNHKAVRVEHRSENKIILTITDGRRQQTLEGSHLLIAAGRVPNSQSLNLAASNIHTDKHGYIIVDDHLETNIAGVFATGDVKGGPAFTHIAYDDFRIIRTNLIDKGDATTTGRLVPYVLYIDPQLGKVGLNEKEARKQGRKYRIAKLQMDHVARAIEVSRSSGFIKVLVEEDNGQILGGMFLGLEGGEMMSMLEIAMIGKLHYSQLRDAIFAHPTLAEAFNNLFSSFEENHS